MGDNLLKLISAVVVISFKVRMRRKEGWRAASKKLKFLTRSKTDC